MKRWMILLVFSVALSWAQGVDDFAWWDSPIVRDLNLSEEQQQKIRSTVRESRSKLIHLRANLEASEAELSDLMNDDQPYLIETPAGPIVSVPYVIEINDFSLFSRRGLTTSQGLEEIKEQFDDAVARGANISASKSKNTT